MFFYKIYGLKVASEIEISCAIKLNNKLTRCDDNNDENINIKGGNNYSTLFYEKEYEKLINNYDVIVRIEQIDKEIKEKINQGKVHEYKMQDGWFRIKDLAIFRIRNGNEVIVYLDNENKQDKYFNEYGELDKENIDSEKLNIFILGTCLGYIMIQRGIVAIHGGAVKASGNAGIISGAQGAGKSTTISKLIDVGFSFISDDVSALRVDDNGDVIVMPAFPQRKLCRDAMIRLGIDVSKYEIYDEFRDKFRIPSIEFFCNEESKVSCIYCLEWIEGDNSKYTDPNVCMERIPHIIEVFGVEKIKLIMDNIFRIEIIREIGIEGEYFKKCMEIATGVRIYRSLKKR